jgi:branched-chain amino acid transport system permease protein
VLYRENGQFKTSYQADQQIFPIAQDRWGVLLLIAFAFVGVPFLADEYMFRAILIPFLILSLAALGVNLLVGYCGQITLGAGAFMAVGAYAGYNFLIRVPDMPLLGAMHPRRPVSAAAGASVRCAEPARARSLPRVATLAAQFFWDWAFLRIKWFTNDSPSGGFGLQPQCLGLRDRSSPVEKYLFCLTCWWCCRWRPRT